ncbi:MAG: cytochrome c oxidase assembly protein [Acidobacteria bacterium]|nr:cytochrome c oxidase assembly protein [Acidobacteriota bacterium]
MSVTSVVLVIVSLSPPVWGWSFRYGFVQAIQFCVFGFAAPTLFVVGAPWLGRRSRGDVANVGAQPRWFQRWNAHRFRERAQFRTLAAAASVIVATLLWRAAPFVNALVQHHWLLPVEAVTLVVPMVFLMVEIVESPPFTPGISRPYRIGVSAVVMWSAWVVAYLAGMSGESWYTAFHHSAGRGISANADQQLSAGFVWLLTASVFVPIVFWNLVHWLQSEEDPDEEIVKLFRQEREHGFFGSAE